MTERPGVLVFDVNETLLDIESLTPIFERVFGDPAVLREWFGQLVLYSMTAALSRRYVDFFTLGAGVLGMLADVHGVPLTAADRADLSGAMAEMPAHPDVTEGLTALRDNGFRMVTLTNSPPGADGRSPLDRAGLGSTSSDSSASTRVAPTSPIPRSTSSSAEGSGSSRQRP